VPRKAERTLAANRVITVAEPLPALVLGLPRPRTRVAAALAALRPRQWTKNLLLFAGILFAAELGDADRWAAAVVAFVAYCVASRAAYLLNDVRDAVADRFHPVKRTRPVASGALSQNEALAISAALGAIALTLAATLGAGSLLCMASFLALQGAYSLGLKSLELVDVLAIALLFVLRAVAGALAVDVRISPWLLLCTFLLALFLALAKRRAELRLEGTRARAALAGYSAIALDRMLGVVAVATVGAYTAYALTAHESRWILATVPLVVYGLARYLRLLRGRGLGEEPEAVLVADLPILVTVAVWATACAVVVAVG
jgi:4-hydroxybenzoate polyprenyltransferase